MHGIDKSGYGFLGLSETNETKKFEKIDFGTKTKIVELSIGEKHALALTSNT